MRTYLLLAAAVAAGTWATLSAAGLPVTVCAWISGASAVTAAVTAGARSRRGMRGAARILSARLLAGSAASRSGRVLVTRARYAAAHRLVDHADRRADGAAAVRIRPGRFARAALPDTDTETP